MKFKPTVLCTLMSIEGKVNKMSEQIDTLAAEFTTAFTEISTALDNIATDEAALAAQITDLVAQLATAGLNAADFDKLVTVRNAATALAVRTKGIADAVPDVPPAA